ncbi:hypothetical protein [Streptomyces sp. McG3]|uniref:hypothetical protein n=1 Tax=Streptomyces sp. McG3 TaxID=2725483 RepID=UPI0035A8C4E0
MHISRPAAWAVRAHRFEAGVERILRSQGATAAPAMVRDLDGIASTFLTDLARDAAMAVREGAGNRFGTVTLMESDAPTPPPLLIDPSGPRPPAGGQADHRQG